MFSRVAAGVLTGLVLICGCNNAIVNPDHEGDEPERTDSPSAFKLLVHEEKRTGEIEWSYLGKKYLAKDIAAFEDSLRDVISSEGVSAVIVAIPKINEPSSNCVEVARSFAAQHNIPLEFEFHSSQIQRER